MPMVDATAGNQTTLIIVAGIGALASVTTAGISAYFARTIHSVHKIVNHDRTVILEGQAQTLRIASIEHPEDESLHDAAVRAEMAAQGAREANA